jgi:hypothetical protein
MECENCNRDVEKASEWFYNDYKIDLLLSFGKMNKDMVFYIASYLMYKDHWVFITDKSKMYNGKRNRLLCTGCFQKGIHKYTIELSCQKRNYGEPPIMQTPSISSHVQYFYNYIQKEDRIILLNKYKKYFFPRNYYLNYARKNPIVKHFVYIV